MATVKEIFETCINKAFTSAEDITDPKERAVAFAEISKALAHTGLIGGTFEETGSMKEALDEPDPVITEKKEKPKAEKKAKDEKPAAAPAKETKKEPEKEEAEQTWTEELVKEKQEQLDFLEEIKEEYGKEEMETCLMEFSKDTLTSYPDDVTPDMIDAFVIYLEKLIEDADDEE